MPSETVAAGARDLQAIPAMRHGLQCDGYDLLEEGAIKIAEAAKLVPGSRPGRKSSFGRILDWILRGSHGVRLEAIRIGGAWHTSRPALLRFFERLAAAKLNKGVPVTRTPHQRAAALARADARLRAAGIRR